MLKKFYILFKIARKLALSDALKVISKIHKPPLSVKILVNFFSIQFSNKDYNLKNLSDEEKLCKSIEGMGTTFIKLGQFLATRPDIISEKLSKQLEKLQDRVPSFSSIEAKNILKDELGEDIYKSILNLSEPIAAASIAQVHKAQINENGTIKDIAIKILRIEDYSMWIAIGFWGCAVLTALSLWSWTSYATKDTAVNHMLVILCVIAVIISFIGMCAFGALYWN